MCGICGIWWRDGAPVDPGLLVRMRDTMAHRGPDGAGCVLLDAAGSAPAVPFRTLDERAHARGLDPTPHSLGLGHRRLSIIDLATGDQPMTNEDGSLWIVFNGEIYNYRELRAELQACGHTFRTQSDTEVILHAYEQYGEDCLMRLNGIFAFALWDARQHRLFLARDHFGVKPLYYWEDPCRFIFASELKAIIQSNTIRREICLPAIDLAFRFGFIPSPLTILAGVRKLAPGHCMVVTSKGIIVRRYWAVVPVLQVRCEAELITELRSRIQTAVERQMMSDVPLGLMLSGGLDSSIVAAVMSQAGPTPHTFTIGVRGVPEIDELSRGRRVATLFATNHHEMVVDLRDYISFLPASFWHLEELCTPSSVQMHFISHLAQRFVKVALTGQGSDEAFAGYSRHLGERYGWLYRILPEGLREQVIAPVVARLPGSQELKRAVSALGISDITARFEHIYQVLSWEQRGSLCEPGAWDGAIRSSAADLIAYWLDGTRHLDTLSQMMFLDARFSLSDNLLMFGDKMAMAASVEARVPMLDLDLMAFVESLPPSMKLRGFSHKYLLKKAAETWLPKSVIYARKIGFDLPMRQWFAGPLAEYLLDLFKLDRSLSRTVFRESEVVGLIARHRDDHEDLWRPLYTLMGLEILHQLFVVGLSVQELPMLTKRWGDDG